MGFREPDRFGLSILIVEGDTFLKVGTQTGLPEGDYTSCLNLPKGFLRFAVFFRLSTVDRGM